MKSHKLIIAAILPLCILKQIDAQSWKTELDSVLNIIEDQEMFHGQILIAEKGQVLFDKAYGNQVNGEPITTRSSLSIQSVTKAFTALSILILQDRGMLHLDDHLTDYFPELPYGEVTIRNLLNMTSGLPRFLPTVINFGDTARQWHNSDIIALIAEHKPKADLPGTKFFYNNDNYMLLGSIIEKASGESYAAFIEHHIFEPLGMEHSYVYEPWETDGSQQISSGFYAVYGEGNIYSTAEDLYIFEQALYTDQLLSTDLLGQSFEYTILTDGTRSNYGFAWRVSDDDHKTEVYIVGDGENSRASIQHYIDDKKSFIYIHNISGKYWKQVYGTARNIWEGKAFEMPVARTVYDIDTVLYKKYTGEYLTKAFGLLHITEENGKLYLRPDPIPGKEELIPSSETTFYFGDQGIDWEFFLDEQGNVIGLGIRGRPETMGPKQMKN